MNWIDRSIRAAAIVVGLSVSSFALAEKPATKPDSGSTPTKPAAKKTGQPAELTKAIEELSKEFKAFADKPDSASLRTSSDYFKTLPADVTADDVLAVIEKSMSGNVVQVSYVKWQLLSGFPSKAEGPQIGKFYQAFRNAPTPLPLFSTDTRVRQQLDKAIIGMKEGQETALNENVQKSHEQVAAFNAVILSYRDALYGRLPTSSDSILVRLQDVAARTMAGLDSNTMLKNIGSDVRGWLAVDASPQQANNLLGVLKDLKKVKGPEVYKSAGWDEKKKAMAWTKPAAKISGETVDEIEKALKEYINNPQGSALKFKK